LGANRLRIVGYFDDLKNKVDVCVETFIADSYYSERKESKINQIRIEWVKEIDECEKFNLAELEKHENRHVKLDDEVLFKKFMFVFEFSCDPFYLSLINLRLVVIDAYLSPGKVECFQILMKLVEYELTQTEFKKELMEKLFVNMDIVEKHVSYFNRWVNSF
jgi:hypothetical protein